MKNVMVVAGTGVVLAIATLWPASIFGAPIQVQLPPETAKFRPADLPGYQLALQKCGICHSADYIAYQPPALTLAQWSAEVTKMRHTYGAPLDDDDITSIAAYLAVAYGNATLDDLAIAATRRSNTSSKPTPLDGPTLLARNGCLGCHAIDQKIVGPSYKDVAARYRSDPLAQSKLEASIRGGSSGKWGAASMPPFPAIEAHDLCVLAAFVLAQR